MPIYLSKYRFQLTDKPVDIRLNVKADSVQSGWELSVAVRPCLFTDEEKFDEKDAGNASCEKRF